jgi:hypothetical protein
LGIELSISFGLTHSLNTTTSRFLFIAGEEFKEQIKIKSKSSIQSFFFTFPVSALVIACQPNQPSIKMAVCVIVPL